MPRKMILPSDLLMTLVWTVLMLILVLIPGLSKTVLNTILVWPMVLFIPGYAAIATLFPKKDDLEVLERIALSSCLSVAIVFIIGLPLYFISRMGFNYVLLVVCLSTVVLIVIAAYRRGKLPEKDRYDMLFWLFYEFIYGEFNCPRSKIDWIKNCILIFFIVIGISGLYFVITAPKIGERFTEFYILGPDGKADNYPAKFKYNYPATVLVGVVNHEYSPVNYTVQIALDNTTLADTWFLLGHNETFEKNMTFVPDKNGTDMKLEFLLFKEDNFTAPYRELYLRVNVIK